MPLLLALTLTALFSGAASAQDFERPEDWKTRFDQPSATEDQLDMYVAMPPGWHVTSGPAGIYWHPDSTSSGTYRVEMEVYLFDPGERREAFGIFVGGRDLEGPGQAYTYFLIRNGGEFIVKERVGAEAPTVHPWTSHEAILAYADRGEDASVENVLAVEVGDQNVRFLVNGERVWEGPREGLSLDGNFGFRVNHGLNLHISRLETVPTG